jgi:coniferyl-aldehyde dehydrogenase
VSTLRKVFDLQHLASRAQTDAPLLLRRERLLRIKAMLARHSQALALAVQADFGVRSSQLTEVADLFLLRAMLAQTLSDLPRWMKPVRTNTPLYLQPSRGFVQRQPIGVVGVISPWNYPLQLALGPVITALAAGNRVMLKPSELTPCTSALLAELIGKDFPPQELSVLLGDAQLAAEFSALPFDHLFFTGSTTVGRLVAQNAAANLTPTTLELGGKSPCIVDVSCDIARAAIKIAHGKLLNAGQTCVAPDYVLLPAGQEAAFSKAFAQAVASLYPRIIGNPDYAAIISERHHARLKGLLDQAEAGGARLEVIDPAQGKIISTKDTKHGEDAAGISDTGHKQMMPVLVFGAPPNCGLLIDEIFGPVLPVLTYDTLDEAIQYINARPRPLALYWFGQNQQSQDKVLTQTVSGGVSINDTLMHLAHLNLPFGGVGDSGWGSYHGEAGFLRLSHQKSVLVQSRWANGNLLYPPYGPRFDWVTSFLKRWM